MKSDTQRSHLRGSVGLTEIPSISHLVQSKALQSAAHGYPRTRPSPASPGWYQASLDPTYRAGSGTELTCCIPCLLRENLAAGSKKRLAVVFCNSWGWGEAERGELEHSRAPESQGTPRAQESEKSPR